MKLPGDPTEAEWQQQVIDLAHTFGWRHMHCRRSIGKGRTWVTATNLAGWPDLVLWSERQQRTIAAELKTNMGVLKPEQVDVLRSLGRAGWEFYCWRPYQLDDIARVLNPRSTNHAMTSPELQETR